MATEQTQTPAPLARRVNRATVAELIRELATDKDLLTPEEVLDKARDAASPLHRFFTWEDSVAAERYRKMQARTLITSVRVFYETAEKQVIQVREFTSLDADRKTGAGYRQLTAVMSDDQLRQEMLATARKELMAFRRKYSQLSELGGVLVAIDETVGGAS